MVEKNKLRSKKIGTSLKKTLVTVGKNVVGIKNKRTEDGFSENEHVLICL